MMRDAWWLLLGLAACNDSGSQNPMTDASTQTTCERDDMCEADQYCAPATKKCEPVLELRGFTASVESFQCAPPGQATRQCAAYRTSFVLHDHSATQLVMRLERVALSQPGGSFSVATSIHCAMAPWMIQAASMSPIIDVTFDYRGGPNDGGWPAWAVPCGTGDLTPEIIDDIGAGPTTGELEIVATLRLSGGATVEARARATLTPF